MSREERKLIPVSVEIINKALILAKKKMTSLNKIAEDALKHAIKLEEELGYDLEYSYNTLKAIKTLRVLGGSFTPRLVLECLMNENCRSSREKLLEKWFESGKLYGAYLRDSSSRIEALKTLLENLRWDFSEIQVVNEDNTYRIRYVSTSMSSEETEYIVKFIEGIITGLTCNLNSTEYIRGLITIKFKC